MKASLLTFFEKKVRPRIAIFGLIIPIMNVLLSALLNGEPLFEWQYIAALALVCVGIFLVNRAPQPKES